MSKNDYRSLSEIEIEARTMRAEALRDGVVALRAWVLRRFNGSNAPQNA